MWRGPPSWIGAHVDGAAGSQIVARARFGLFRVIGKRFDDLLRRASGGGGIGYVEVYDSSAMMQQDPKHVEHPEGRSRHDEEVDGDEVGEVVVEERAPALRGWLRATRDEPGNGLCKLLLQSCKIQRPRLKDPPCPKKRKREVSRQPPWPPQWFSLD